MGFAMRNAITENGFVPFLHKGRLDPRSMTAAQMLSLMIESAAMGFSRELTASQAA